VRESKVNKVLLDNKPLYLLFCKNNILIANNSNKPIVPASVEFLLQKYKDVFPKKSQMATTVKGIEHHIDRILEASLPNRPAYRSNPQETQEFKNKLIN